MQPFRLLALLAWGEKLFLVWGAVRVICASKCADGWFVGSPLPLSLPVSFPFSYSLPWSVFLQFLVRRPPSILQQERIGSWLSSCAEGDKASLVPGSKSVFDSDPGFSLARRSSLRLGLLLFLLFIHSSSPTTLLCVSSFFLFYSFHSLSIAI